jgi:hypothetical protein
MRSAPKLCGPGRLSTIQVHYAGGGLQSLACSLRRLAGRPGVTKRLAGRSAHVPQECTRGSGLRQSWEQATGKPATERWHGAPKLRPQSPPIQPPRATARGRAAGPSGPDFGSPHAGAIGRSGGRPT